MSSPAYLMLGFALKFWFMQMCNIDKNEHTKLVNHPRVCPMLYAMPYVHLLSISQQHKNKIQFIGIKIDTCLDANV